MYKIINRTLPGLHGIGLLLLLLTGHLAEAQQGSQGNTTIFGGAQMTLFGAHSFATGGGGTQPGIIKTIRTAPPGILGFGPAASYTGADDANHVDGYVSKMGTSAFVFPVGNGTKLRPVGISAPAASGTFKAAYWSENPHTATLPAGGPFPVTNLGAGVTKVSTAEYWDLDGPSAVNITLTWDAASAVGTLTNSNIATLVIAGYNPVTGKWESLGNAGGTTGSLASTGSVTATGVVPDMYTAFTFGADVSLPVTLVAFKASKENTTTLLSWSTTLETNSDRFEIERSANGKQWTRIGTIASHGESSVLKNYSFTDISPLGGENLYRLKMIDRAADGRAADDRAADGQAVNPQDGAFTYSRIESVTFEDAGAFVYPNPSADVIYLRDVDQVKSVSLTDLNGKTVYNLKTLHQGAISVRQLNAGIYIVKIVSADGVTKTQKIVVTK